MTLPPRPPSYINFFEPFHFTAGDQLVVPIGASHISLPLQEIQSREWEKKKTNKRTIRLGLTQVQKESYVTLCMCRLTLVWILAKLLQSYWNADSSWLVFPHCSGLHLMPTGLSAVPCRLVSPSPLDNCSLELLCPTLWPAFPSYFRSPEISNPKPFVWFPT